MSPRLPGRRAPRPRRVRVALAVAPVLLVAGAVPALGARAASAATCVGWSGVQPPNPGTVRNELMGVAVLSPCNAWTVGRSGNAAKDEHSLIEHWNGSSWTVTPSPVPGSFKSRLLGVHAISAADIWAAGSYSDGPQVAGTLTLHWNGRAWKQVPSPTALSSPELNAVGAASARDVWAVGDYNPPAGARTLIMHWNGRAWRRLPSPSPGLTATLTGVAAVSASNAWAVGNFIGTGGEQTFILHWNGRTWQRQPSPNPGLANVLFAVAATSASNAWAVGSANNGTTDKTLILHWNGHHWAQVPSPNAGGPTVFNQLSGVAALSAVAAWAVGDYNTPDGVFTLVLAWNGRTWQRQPSPTLGSKSDAQLVGVDASSPTDVWAVGNFDDVLPWQALALHCC
jgi:hypothetical protein